MNTEQFRVPPGATVQLTNYDPDNTAGVTNKQEAEAKLSKLRKQLSDLSSTTDTRVTALKRSCDTTRTSLSLLLMPLGWI